MAHVQQVMSIAGMSLLIQILCSLLPHLSACIHRDGKVGTNTIFPSCAGNPLLVSTARQRPHYIVLIVADLSDGNGGEVRQQLLVLSFCVWILVHPGFLRKLQHICEVYRTALDVIELCAEVQWILAFQKPVSGATAVHSFDATFLPQSNPLADLVDVEENGLCWDLLPAVVQDTAQDLQCLQSPIHNNVGTHTRTLVPCAYLV